MVNILEEDSAEKVIQLERQAHVGPPTDIILKDWETEVKKDIDKLRSALRQQMPLQSISSGSNIIYGSGGINRYSVKPDGEVVFLIDFCNKRVKDKARESATELGFEIL